MSVYYLSDDERRRLLDSYTSDQDWQALFELAKRNIAEQYAQFVREQELRWDGISPIARLHGAVDADGRVYFGVPRREVDLSPEAMREMRNALLLDLDDDAPLGTSADTDPRGYWMPIDGEVSR